MSSSDIANSCTICEKPNARACARCKSSQYCSKECQADDWPVHRLLCASFASFDMSARPSQTHMRSILFPQDQPKPQICWVECKWKDDDGVAWQSPQLKSFMGSESPTTSITIPTDALLQRLLPDKISIWHRDTFLVDGSLPNKSIARILATLPGEAHDWRGPIVAIGREGQSLDPTNCRDLDMSDFRYIADYLISYGRWPLDLLAPATALNDKIVKGIRINCLGDRQVFNRPHYELVDVSSTDPVFNPHWRSTSDIADRIGLPILTRRCPVSLRWAGKDARHDFGNNSPYNNQDATFLHLCCDPRTNSPVQSGRNWGWADSKWQSHVGSVIVVRRDGNPLAPMHVEALCGYCRHEIRPLMAHTIGEYTPDEPLDKDLVLKMICRPTFSIFWYKLSDRKREAGEDISAPFPYTV